MKNVFVYLFMLFAASSIAGDPPVPSFGNEEIKVFDFDENDLKRTCKITVKISVGIGTAECSGSGSGGTAKEACKEAFETAKECVDQAINNFID